MSGPAGPTSSGNPVELTGGEPSQAGRLPDGSAAMGTAARLRGWWGPHTCAAASPPEPEIDANSAMQVLDRVHLV
jgi:hypothetical protein